MTPDKLPLNGFTIIEIGHSIAAPYAGNILGDLGADLIKVEKPDGGDDARKWAPPYWGDTASTFLAFNRNKRSVVVNLKDPGELARLKELIIKRADAVIQNLRPQSAEEIGLDAASLRKVKPALVYCTIGAFGAAGPYKDRPGYDPLMQAFAGLMSVTGEPGHRPVRVGTSVIDMAAGMWAVIGVVSALLRRTASGAGSTVDTSLYETALGWMNYHAANFQASGKVPERQGSGAPMIAPYKGYETSDGFIVIAAGNDKLFAGLARALGHPEWIDDARYRTNPDRVKNKDDLYRSIDAIICQQPSSEWQLVLDKVGIPNAPIQTMDQVLAHPQTKALGILQESPDNSISLFGLPVSFDGERPPFRRHPPRLGADTDEIFKRTARIPAEKVV